MRHTPTGFGWASPSPRTGGARRAVRELNTATYDLGANSYVQKPVDFDEFLTAARQIGVYWLDVNQVPPLDALPEST